MAPLLLLPPQPHQPQTKMKPLLQPRVKMQHPPRGAQEVLLVEGVAVSFGQVVVAVALLKKQRKGQLQ